MVTEDVCDYVNSARGYHATTIYYPYHATFCLGELLLNNTEMLFENQSISQFPGSKCVPGKIEKWGTTDKKHIGIPISILVSM